MIDLFNSRPEYDVVHAALHGKYDAQGGQEGIVLLRRKAPPAPTAQFLTPTMLEAGTLPHGPFVFLNACQVASDETVLGDYAGFASTLLRIGAGGVVAPLWNVRDDIAQRWPAPSTRPRSAPRRCPPPKRCAPYGRRTPRTAPAPMTRSSTPP